MDENFAVAATAPINFFTFHVAHHDVLESDFVKTITVWFHDEDVGIFGRSDGHMAASQVALPCSFKNMACINQALFEFVQSHVVAFVWRWGSNN